MKLDATQIFNEMSLREKIGQMFLHEYQGFEDIPEDLREMNRKSEFGGVILFAGGNVRNVDQLHEMNTKLMSYASENKYGLPPFISLDQEGGQLTALFRGTTIFPGNQALGFTGSPELARKQGVHVGQELRYAGINLSYAPVLDVAYDNKFGKPIVDNRMYSDEPEVVAELGAAYIEGLQSEGVLGCGKHFPGMRPTDVDTHHEVDRIEYDMDRLESVELTPFKKAIEAGVEVIMTHHGIFEAFDKEYPASLSPTILRYLREELKFDGLIISDDLIMGAIQNQFGDEESLILGINAGLDLLISTNGKRWFIDFIEKCVKEGKVSEERINESVQRILKVKCRENFGLIPTEKPFDKAKGDTLSKEIAQAGIIWHKGDKDKFPMTLSEETRLGIVMGNPARLVMSDATNLYDDISFKATLLQQGFQNPMREAIMPWAPTHEEEISVGDIAIISEVVLVSTVNAYRFTGQEKVLKYIREMNPNKHIIGIASRSPNDVTILDKYCDTVVASAGITPFQIEALMSILFEKGK